MAPTWHPLARSIPCGLGLAQWWAPSRASPRCATAQLGHLQGGEDVGKREEELGGLLPLPHRPPTPGHGRAGSSAARQMKCLMPTSPPSPWHLAGATSQPLPLLEAGASSRLQLTSSPNSCAKGLPYPGLFSHPDASPGFFPGLGVGILRLWMGLPFSNRCLDLSLPDLASSWFS